MLTWAKSLGIMDHINNPPPIAPPCNSSNKQKSVDEAPPPLKQEVTRLQNAANPSPLTLPSSMANNGNSAYTNISVSRVEFQVSEEGHALSIPVTTAI